MRPMRRCCRTGVRLLMIIIENHPDAYAPTVYINGVPYFISQGDGVVWDRVFQAWDCVWVWRVVHLPEYTAPPHVSRACDAAYDLACEVARCESIAGWDPNP